jgi:hypothetical protein
MDTKFMLLNLLSTEVDCDQLFLEICHFREVLPFFKGEPEPSIIEESHSENKNIIMKSVNIPNN